MYAAPSPVSSPLCVNKFILKKVKENARKIEVD
jgi:hypothetical protein